MCKALSIASLMLFMSGCMHVTYRTAKPQVMGESDSGTRHYFIFGLVGRSHIDVERLCPNGDFAKLALYKSFGDGFLDVITLGIYTPRSWRIWCATPENLEGSTKELQGEQTHENI